MRPFRSSRATEDLQEAVLRLEMKVINLEHENTRLRLQLAEMAEMGREAKKLALHRIMVASAGGAAFSDYIWRGDRRLKSD